MVRWCAVSAHNDAPLRLVATATMKGHQRAETRYETAIDLVQDTDNTITHIASLLGYSDPTHFARTFRIMTAVSPREYMLEYHG